MGGMGMHAVTRPPLLLTIEEIEAGASRSAINAV